MAVPGSGSPLLFSADAGAGGFAIERSLRFNSADSAYLSRTPASAGNRRTFTWSGWLKRSAFNDQDVFSAQSSTAYFTARLQSDNTLRINHWTSGVGDQILYISSQVFRDPSSWYHFVVAVDTTQATSTERIKAYVNGTQITTWSSSTAPSQNLDTVFNTANTHFIGGTGSGTFAGQYLNGYLADVYLIDGSALDPTSFGEFDATTGVWNPIAYTGSYGTNGFHLDFADNSSAAALGYDAAGSNDWTVNNLSVTAGAGNDSLRDSPTNGDTANDTGLGGELPGNYCTWNPLSLRPSTGRTLSNGNLDTNGDDSNFNGVLGTFGMPSGKWYWECTVGTVGFYNQTFVGIAKVLGTSSYIDYGYYSDTGQKREGSTSSAYGATFTSNDVIGIAFDADNGTLTFYKNGVSQGVAFTSIPSANYQPCLNGAGLVTYSANFGQRAFAYSAPSGGFKCLCTANLDTPTIEDPSTVMDVALYTGNAPSTQTITGLGFSPDMVWIKNRSVTGNHVINDIVRGAGQRLITNLTSSESTDTDRFSAFTSDGFTVGDSTDTNGSSNAIVAWAWDAGTSNATNTSGSITSTVRANISAGFSVVTYNAGPLPAATGATVGHGLGIAPQFIVVKDRTNANPWGIYHTSLGPGKGLLFSTAAEQVASTWWNNTAPTSSVFSINSDIYATAQPNDDYVAYCFAPVAGYSAFGSYTGNGSTDGPFVYTGMRPRWIMTKASSRLSAWYIHDTARGTYNVIGPVLAANTSAAEITPTRLDILSNGFKIRDNDSEYNASGDTYVWAAFAEHPFAYARAR